jgi:hypothetical protein
MPKEEAAAGWTAREHRSAAAGCRDKIANARTQNQLAAHEILYCPQAWA